MFSKFLIIQPCGFSILICVVFINSAVFASQKSPSEAAEELCNMAIRLGTSDNVTVVIAQFMHS